MVKKKRKLLSVLPDFLSYRFNEYVEASKSVDIELVIGDSGTGFSEYKEKYQKKFHVKSSKVVRFWKFYFQTNTISSYLFSSYDVFFIQAHFKYIDFWIILFLNRFIRRELYLHGQGLYRYKNPSIIRKFVYKFVLGSCRKYICYNQYTSDDLHEKIGFNANNIWLNNTIKFFSSCKENHNKRFDGDVIFIGRVRERSNVKELISAFESSDLSLVRKLHILGDGELLAECKESSKSNNVIFYGQITDEDEIERIAVSCSYGIYPGDAGLSLVHYAHLNLIPIFHSEHTSHMGPEFAYFLDIEEEVSFPRGDLNQAMKRIENITESEFEYISLSMNKCYQSIDEKSFGNALKDVI